MITFMASYQNYPGAYALKTLHKFGEFIFFCFEFIECLLCFIIIFDLSSDTDPYTDLKVMCVFHSLYLLDE